MRAARREALSLAALLAVSCGTDVIRLQSHVGDAPTKPECISFAPAVGALCVYCGADYSVQRACLKCPQPADASGCVSCMWGDGVGGAAACKQCVDASGLVSTIGCTEVRPDLQVDPGQVDPGDS